MIVLDQYFCPLVSERLLRALKNKQKSFFELALQL